MLKIVLVFLLAFSSLSQEHNSRVYDNLINQVERDYRYKKKDYDAKAGYSAYFWEIEAIMEFPLHCLDSDSIVVCDFIVYRDGYGGVIGKLKGEKTQVQIPIVSYIKRKGTVTSKVHRMYFYELNSRGTWFKYRKTRVKKIEFKDGMWSCL